MNQWWNTPLYLTTRGLTTSPMPYGDRTLSIDFDFTEHRLVIADSDARVRTLALTPRTVCDFYQAVFGELAALDVRVRIGTAPQECPVKTDFPDDMEHGSYDPAAAHQVWQVFRRGVVAPVVHVVRSEEHTSELQSHLNLVCRLLLEKKKKLPSPDYAT